MTGSRVSWRWHSSQGARCIENRDACGIYQCSAYTLSVVMDAFPRGKHGLPFNSAWMTRLLDGMKPELPAIADMLALLRQAQQQIRTMKYLAERASYLAALFPHGTREALAFHCGDCTLGIQSVDGKTRWLTPTHTLADFHGQRGWTPNPTQRHILTRTLNARRFHHPEITALTAPPAGTWIIATDGYRHAEYDKTGHPADDCSHLLVWTGLCPNPGKPASNLYFRKSAD
ncbi:hypothetical protein F3J16_15645 [Burkholderia sp. Ap-962]|uniref:hypothetical protein n=1 Tax=Burkholderia sp. Ap-962 TaxID=2608333 RepID=UPI0014234A2D|nr:hypothetical protein [Burkholderia sp. Ap-962]NIF71609.1 hypothetical protein [Burkholderia sp. Ap-962]